LGVWGTDLFSDDIACDVRDHYRQLLEDSVEDSVATRLTLEKFERYLEEPDGIALIAFAVTQSKVGRLEPGVRDQALAIIDAGADLALWEQENPKLLSKRRAVLEKARAQLDRSTTGPETPAPAQAKALRPRCWRRSRPGAAAARGAVARSTRARSSPWRTTGPRGTGLRRHPGARARCARAPWSQGQRSDHLHAPVVIRYSLLRIRHQRIDWRGAGFEKVQTITSRAGDEQGGLPNTGTSWAELAERYRRRPAQ